MNADPNTFTPELAYVRSIFVMNAKTPISSGHPDAITEERGAQFDRFMAVASGHVELDNQAKEIERLTGIIGQAVHFLSSGHGVSPEEAFKQLHEILDGSEAELYASALRKEHEATRALKLIRDEATKALGNQ